MSFCQEHVGEVCSHQLLTSVRRMVLKLTQQNDESKEFVQFFHRQLGGILQVSTVGKILFLCSNVISCCFKFYLFFYFTNWFCVFGIDIGIKNCETSLLYRFLSS